MIVPVHNAARWLGECVDSLSGQTFRDIEIVCVDDGSTDGSDRILADRAARDPRIVILTQRNSGVAASRNRGIDAARGEWLMFMDADDHTDPDTCDRALGAAVATGADIVMWPYVREWEGGRSSVRRLMEGDRVIDGPDVRLLHRRIVGPVGKELRDPTQLHSWGTVWGKLYSREVIAGARFTDTRLVGSAEDALFNVDVFCRATRVCHIDRAMYHYRKTDETMTAGYNAALNRGWERLHATMAEMIEARALGVDFREALDGRIALGLVGQGLNECRSGRSLAGKTAAMREIISTGSYRRAIRDLPLGHMPLRWRLYFGAARRRMAPVVLALTLVIAKLR